MSDVYLEKVNETYIKVDCNDEVAHNLYTRYSEYSPGYIFSPQYKMHIWDGMIHMYTPRSSTLPIGLLQDAMAYLKASGENIHLTNFKEEDLIDETIDDWFDDQMQKNMVNCKFPLRDYQSEAIYKALKNKKGLLLSCTSSGKSLMIFNIILSLLTKKELKKIMIVVPNKTLVEQLYNDFIDYGWNGIDVCVSKLYDEEKKNVDFRKPVLITTWQSVYKKERSFFEEYQAVICDEAHQSKAKALSDILKACVNAKYKLGTTGTLSTEKSDNLIIRSIIGDILFELRSKDLIEKGYLTKITIANIVVKYPMEFIKSHKNLQYNEEVSYVEEYEDRNNALDLILEHTPDKHNILLLVNHRDHEKSLQSYLSAKYPNRKVSIIDGSVKAKEREKIRTGIENEDGTILLATFGTMSTGVNIPKLHAVVLYSNSKSKIKVLQSIGRGLRKHNTKSHVILYDIIDDLSYYTKRGKHKKNYLLQHWEERCKYYIEQEFPQLTTIVKLPSKEDINVDTESE